MLEININCRENILNLLENKLFLKILGGDKLDGRTKF